MIPSLKRRLEDTLDRYGGRDRPMPFFYCYTIPFNPLKDAFLAFVAESSKWRFDPPNIRRDGLSFEFNLSARTTSGRFARVIVIGSDELAGMVVFECPGS